MTQRAVAGRAVPCGTLPYSPSLAGMLHETLAELDAMADFAGATQRYWDICRDRMWAKAATTKSGTGTSTSTSSKKKAGDAA